MSKYSIEDTTLIAIGDAIRAKGNTEDKILVSDLATAITNLPSGDIEVEPIVLSGNQDYGCAGSLAGNYINMFGDSISTENITSGEQIFYYNKTVKKIPFDINFKTGTSVDLSRFYSNCEKLTVAPMVNNVAPNSMSQMFYYCLNLREIPEGFGDNWNWNSLHTRSYSMASNVFNYCFSLRKIPASFLSNIWTLYTSAYGTNYYMAFASCYVLDELIGVAVSPAAYTSNAFSSHLGANYRLKEYTFQTNEDGTAKTANWKNQTIDLSVNIGYANGQITNANTNAYIIGYNSGITMDTVVTDDASYQALKDNPDWWTYDVNYSRYNHTSAVNTINSLPDCSATGTNTIKFTGAAGAKTDGGAINTLTEEEIAVAAAKGWTVSLS